MVDEFQLLVVISPNNIDDSERPEKRHQSRKQRGEDQRDLLRDGVKVDGHGEFEMQIRSQQVQGLQFLFGT